MELSIDTSTRYAGICLSQEGEALLELTWRSQQNHTVELAPSVEALLHRLNATPQDLTALIIAQGPGNFSALRVGMSYVKGLAFALQLPVVAISSLEVEAAPYRDLGLPVYALLDAGRSEVVWARFEGQADQWRQQTQEQVTTIEELCRNIERPALLCGEGTVRWREALGELLGDRARVATTTLPSRRPAILAHLGHQRLLLGESADVATLQPRYARAPSITPPNPPRPIR